MTIVGGYEESSTLEILLGETLGSSGSSYVDVSADVLLAGPSVLALGFLDGFDELDLRYGDFFEVIIYRGSLTGEFGAIDDTGAPLTQGAWSVSYDVGLGEGERSVRLSYVPEPGTGLLIGLGFAALGIRQRRHVAKRRA
jgi:hypothetical protein